MEGLNEAQAKEAGAAGTVPRLVFRKRTGISGGQVDAVDKAQQIST